MKALSVHVKKFNIDNFLIQPITPAENNGSRLKYKYKYDNGVEAACVLVTDRIPLTFGITPPFVSEGTVPKKGWDVCVGPREVRRDKADLTKFYVDPPGKYGGVYKPESVVEFYRVLQLIDDKVKKYMDEHHPGDCTKFTSALRTQRNKPGSKKPVKEEWCVRCHMNTDMKDRDLITTSLSDKKGPVKDYMSFVRKSKLADTINYICVASGYLNSNGELSQQLRVNHILMLSEGSDPSVKEKQILYENEDIDYCEDFVPIHKLAEDEETTSKKRVKVDDSSEEEECELVDAE